MSIVNAYDIEETLDNLENKVIKNLSETVKAQERLEELELENKALKQEICRLERVFKGGLSQFYNRVEEE